MYGTCARMVVKPENREKLQAIFDEEPTDTKGYIASHVLMENDTDNVCSLSCAPTQAEFWILGSLSRRKVGRGSLKNFRVVGSTQCQC